MQEPKRKPPADIVAGLQEPTLFSPQEIQLLIQDAFTGAVNPAWGGKVLSDKRLAYCRNFSKILIERLEAQDVLTGHMTYVEAVATLLGAALVLQRIHCYDLKDSE